MHSYLDTGLRTWHHQLQCAERMSLIRIVWLIKLHFKPCSEFANCVLWTQQRLHGRGEHQSFPFQRVLLQVPGRRALAVPLLITSLWPQHSNISPPAQLLVPFAVLIPSRIKGNFRLFFFSMKCYSGIISLLLLSS